MPLPQQYAHDMLLLHVLTPFLGAVLLGSLVTASRPARILTTALHLLLAATSGLLCLHVLWAAAQPEADAMLVVAWRLPGAIPGYGFFERVVWGIDPLGAGLLALLPWLSLTGILFEEPGQISPGRQAGQLLILGSIDLFLVGWDIGSMISGASLAVLLMAIQLTRQGGIGKRPAATLFLNVQAIGGILLLAALALFVSGAGVIRAAPHGVPGSSFTTLPELAKLIQTAQRQHPAAQESWQACRGLPVVLLLTGVGLMTATFPFQAWFSQVLTPAPLSARLWQLAWMKAVLLAGLRVLTWIDPQSLHDLAVWGSSAAVLGCFCTAAILFFAIQLSKLASAAVQWSHHLSLVCVFALAGGLERSLLPLLLGQLAALVLLFLTLTILADRLRSNELTACQGRCSQAGWLGPVLVVALLTLTLTPSVAGMFLARLTTIVFVQFSSGLGTLWRWLFLFSNLLALAGLSRATVQLLTGSPQVPDSLPETEESPQGLPLSRNQLLQLWFWGVLALALTWLGPALLLWQPEAAQPAG